MPYRMKKTTLTYIDTHYAFQATHIDTRKGWREACQTVDHGQRLKSADGNPRQRLHQILLHCKYNTLALIHYIIITDIKLTDKFTRTFFVPRPGTSKRFPHV